MNYGKLERKRRFPLDIAIVSDESANVPVEVTKGESKEPEEDTSTDEPKENIDCDDNIKSDEEKTERKTERQPTVYYSSLSPPDPEEFQDAMEDEKNVAEENIEATDESKEKEVKEDNTPQANEKRAIEVEPVTQDESITLPSIQLPLCTLTVKLEYTPSIDDQRDTLYEKLNDVSKRKVSAIEALRKNTSAVSRSAASRVKAAEVGSGSPTKSDKPAAVKSGFLNKKAAAPVPFWKRWFDKTIGPKSLLWVIGPLAKNYVVFVGVSILMHYKGDLLALPPPV